MKAPAACSMPDATLNYWGDVFVESGLGDAMTFLHFIEMTPELRWRRLLARQQMALRTERLLAPHIGAAVRNGTLIEPFRPPGRRLRRRPWFFHPRS